MLRKLPSLVLPLSGPHSEASHLSSWSASEVGAVSVQQVLVSRQTQGLKT